MEERKKARQRITWCIVRRNYVVEKENLIMDKSFNVLTKIDTRSEFEKMIDVVKSQRSQQIELIKISSEYARIQFNSLVKEGFTEEQALQITIQQPTWK